jgi:hypothetical protein
MAERTPLDWDEFVHALERKYDRGLSPMDYIRAIHDHIVAIESDLEWLAQRMPDNQPPAKSYTPGEMAKLLHLVADDETGE